ncbi:MAG: AMP-binding protein [Ignavibacteria bacterium]|nr:AMP-binding protein [Ignavibacteria bacterium]
MIKPSCKQINQKGITPGDCIGICLKRSAEMIISLLGILKSGAAYVPVDPSFPEDRIQYLLEDSGVKILITSEDIPVKFENGSRKIF